MAKSMTGYGRADAECAGRTVTVEIRAVNNRYLDCGFKLPRSCLFLEDELRTRVKHRIFRGKLDVYVTVGANGEGTTEVALNRSLAQSYYRALTELRELCGFSDSLRVGDIARFPDVLTVATVQENTEEIGKAVCDALEKALSVCDEMRRREGARLGEDIASRLGTLEALLERIELHAPETAAAYSERLHAKISEVLQGYGGNIDEGRILTEVAILADKLAVDEETVRLHSHIAQFRTMLADTEPTGRRMDFLIQEMNRECNTIGSKAGNLSIANDVVAMKAEIEKIREQVQNIE